MNAGRFLSVFDSRHVVLPVIHVRDRAQAQANADIAHAAGADGVFLINHAIGDAELLELHAEVAARHRRWFVGINCVGLSPRTVFAKLTPAVAGLWVDDAGIDERVSVQIEAKAIAAARRASGWSGLYFGGVGLERREVEDVTATTLAARDYMDVVTTTGAGPGEPAPLAKIRAMRAALGPSPLAVASGITAKNVGDYLADVECFLVATGISRSEHELDPRRVAELVAVIRAHDGQSRRLTRSTYGLGRDEDRGGHRIVLASISEGAVFEIDLDGFTEPDPTFAYCDDVGSRVDRLDGLEEVGTAEIEGDDFGGLHGARQARLLRATQSGGVARFRSRGVGEFGLEVHHVRADGSAPQLLWRDDFCFK